MGLRRWIRLIKNSSINCLFWGRRVPRGLYRDLFSRVLVFNQRISHPRSLKLRTECLLNQDQFISFLTQLFLDMRRDNERVN